MRASIFAAALAVTGLAVGSVHAAPVEWWEPLTSDANTIGLWHFDDVTGATGSFADSGPGANNGTLTSNTGGVTLTTPVTSGAGAASGIGQFGKALQYSAAGGAPTTTGALNWSWGTVPYDSGDMALTASPDTRMTVEAWIRPSAADVAATDPRRPGSPTTEVYIVGNLAGGGGWNLGLVGGKLYFEYASYQTNGVIAPAALAANTWYHVAATYIENETDGWDDHAHLYVNGVEVINGDYYSSGIDGTINPTTAPLVFGNRGTGTDYSLYNGDLDEVRYSNIARTFGAVPEPTSVVLMAVGALGLGLRRRRTIA